MDQKQLSLFGLALALSLQTVFGVTGFTLETKCYYPKLQTDQHFDDSTFITDMTLYPELEVSTALAGLGPQGAAINFFLQTTSTCFNETKDHFITQTYTGTEYGYQCACPTDRRLIMGVREPQQTCWVVNPLNQDIIYASCGGFCRLGYGRIDTRTEGYHCIPRGRTQRSFLVYCSPHGQQALHPDPYSVDPSNRRPNPRGSFSILSLVLPSYCGCRGYFCT